MSELNQGVTNNSDSGPLGGFLTDLLRRGRLDRHKPLAVAVSGGGDSVALLRWMADWAATHHLSLHVLTIDHGLRPEAADEAEFVSRLAAIHGATFELVKWNHPSSGQAAARDARQRLLAKAAHQAGAQTLFFGHTLDDVLETMIMRRRRGVRSQRLAGPSFISASPVWPEGRGLMLVRPFLFQRRAALRRWLVANACNWVDEPSNLDQRYERVRVRNFLNRHRSWDITLAEMARRALLSRQADDAVMAKHMFEPGRFRVDPDGLILLQAAGLDGDLLIDILSLFVRAASGSDRMPRRHKLITALAELDAPGKRQTLSGAWLQRDQAGYRIGRDPGMMTDEVQNGLWDGRFEPSLQEHLPVRADILVRQTNPPGRCWRPVLGPRIRHEAEMLMANVLSDAQLDAVMSPIDSPAS